MRTSPGGGGGGDSGTEGGRTRVTYFVEEGVFFKTFAHPRFVKEGYFLYPGTKYGGGGGGGGGEEVKIPYNQRNIRSSDAE